MCSANLYSERKPRVPRLKERIGGTEVEVEKREEAWRIVPSPPNVVARSVFWWRVCWTEGEEGECMGKGS